MLRVRTIFSGTTGAPYVNTLFFDGTGSVNAASAVAAAGAFWEDLEPAMSDDLLWTTSDEVTEMTEAGQVVGVYSIAPISGAGTATSERVARAVQGLIRLRTGIYVAGREVRGRVFVPGATEGMNANGQVLAATQAVMQAAVDTLVSTAVPNLVVWSRKNATAIPVEGGTAWNEWAVLTSRRD